MGGVIVIIGLYLVLWGKEKDQQDQELDANFQKTPYLDNGEHKEANHSLKYKGGRGEHLKGPVQV